MAARQTPPRQTPLQIINQEHGGKEKLVDALLGMLDRGDESKADLRTRLLAAANSKLLRLHSTMTEVSQRFGDKDKLVSALLELLNKAKDTDYREKLMSYTPVRLLGMHRDAARRSRRKKVA